MLYSSDDMPVLQPQAPQQPRSLVPKRPGGLQSVPGAGLTKIDPNDDLRGTQITPQDSARQRTIDSQVDTARNNVANWTGYTPYQAPDRNDQYTQGANRNLDNAQTALGSVKSYGGYAAINPNDSYSGDAASMLRSVQGAGGLNYSADTAGVRSGLVKSLENLDTAPNRGELAAGQYDLLTRRSQPQFEQELRQVGQKAAALGRVGAGMTTSDLGTVQQRREEALANERQRLALEAAGLEMGDRLSRVQAGQGVLGQLGGLDEAQAAAAYRSAGLGLDASRTLFDQGSRLRDEARGERGFQFGVDEANNDLGFRRAGAESDLGQVRFGMGSSLRNESRTDQDRVFDREQAGLSARRGIFGDLSGAGVDQFNRERMGRDELRGERDYQNYMEGRAFDRARGQRFDEESLLDRRFDREQDYLRSRYGIANDYDPTGLNLDEAGRQQDRADRISGDTGDLMGEWLLQEQLRGRNRGRLDDAIGPPTWSPQPRITEGRGVPISQRPAPTRFPRYGE